MLQQRGREASVQDFAMQFIEMEDRISVNLELQWWREEGIADGEMGQAHCLIVT
jgi:hypothetical protein